MCACIERRRRNKSTNYWWVLIDKGIFKFVTVFIEHNTWTESVNASAAASAADVLFNRPKNAKNKTHPKKENRKQTKPTATTTNEKKLYCRDITCFEWMRHKVQSIQRYGILNIVFLRLISLTWVLNVQIRSCIHIATLLIYTTSILFLLFFISFIRCNLQDLFMVHLGNFYSKKCEWWCVWAWKCDNLWCKGHKILCAFKPNDTKK